MTEADRHKMMKNRLKQLLKTKSQIELEIGYIRREIADFESGTRGGTDDYIPQEANDGT